MGGKIILLCLRTGGEVGENLHVFIFCIKSFGFILLFAGSNKRVSSRKLATQLTLSSHLVRLWKALWLPGSWSLRARCWKRTPLASGSSWKQWPQTRGRRGMSGMTKMTLFLRAGKVDFQTRKCSFCRQTAKYSNLEKQVSNT